MEILAYDIKSAQAVGEYLRQLPVVKRPKGNNGGKIHMPKYVKSVSAFDIETTYLPEYDNSIMYIWQWCFDDQFCIYGRTWQEFRDLRDVILCALCERTLCVFVHNLSFEFQFLADPTIYEFQEEDVFCMRSRKILKCDMPNYHLEFRCSYLHSNMGLERYLQSMNVEHKKLELDYKKVRYPWTDLTPAELAYCVNDVIGLCEAITKEMLLDGDTLYTYPLTSTGYVRRDAKRSMKKHRQYIKGIIPNYEIYQMLREAFRGGDTHANRLISGRILENVHSYDRSSSYPDVILNCKFPMSEFINMGHIEEDELLSYIRRGYAVIMRIALTDVRLADDTFPDPYISVSQCRRHFHFCADNGRIVEAPYLETTITDVDYVMIKDIYRSRCFYIIEAAISKYGKLPSGLREINIEYYRKKTALKGVDGQDYYYMKSKNKLNSVYGMTAQDPLRNEVKFTYDPLEPYKVEQGTEEKYNKDQGKQWLSYAWGVWVTSWARFRLYEAIKIVHNTPGAFHVYNDTDSVKYVGEVDFSAYNKKRQEDSIKNGAYADDPKGRRHYMGVYEQEHDYDRFITWGAKKYAYDINGKTGVTVSGVNKAAGGPELQQAGGLEKFRPGFVFRIAGGVEVRYNDHCNIDAEIDGHSLHIGRGVSILDSEYTLGLTSAYTDLIKYSEIDGEEILLW